MNKAIHNLGWGLLSIMAVGCSTTVTLATASTPPVDAAPLRHAIRDAQGRHVVPRGFVVMTNDGPRPATYSPDDYARMARMGANFQVIRLELGKLSTYPGASVDETYLARLDTLVRLGRDAGMKTVFKMTSYGVQDFSWEKFWRNENQERQCFTEAWRLIWQRYRAVPDVWGYDLVNEPRKLTMDISYDDLTARYLVPFYQELIDASNQVDASKAYLIQSIFMNKGEGIDHNQYAEIKVPISRKNIFYSPHIYLSNPEWVAPVLKRIVKESAMLEAPILIGEWGFPTFATTDVTLAEQLKYMDLYFQTVAAFDQLGIGTIKAWFSGNPTMQNFLKGGASTWAIFSDKQAVGTVERKYIIDAIARPYPQTIAGDLRSFKFDPATRTLAVSLKTDNRLGASRIFVGADRHYPDGFSVLCGDQFILAHNPLKQTGLDVLKSDAMSNPADFIWDESKQQLIILRWPADQSPLTLRIVPGLDPNGESLAHPPKPSPASAE